MPSARSTQHCCFSIPATLRTCTNLCLGFILFNGYWSRQHLLSEWYKLLCRLHAMQSFEWRPTVSTLLTPGQNAPRMFHQPRQDWGVFSGFFLHAALHITAFSTNPLEGLYPLTASSSVTSALQFSPTRILNAVIAGSVSLYNVISL